MDAYPENKIKKGQEDFCPLAQKLRPKKINEIIGQEHLTGQDGLLQKYFLHKKLGSLIFWGPPGTGKTSAAQALAEALGESFSILKISAVFSGVAELKKIFDKARQEKIKGLRTVVFIDEIHRFNKTQQDCLLPVLEDGTIILIGATTENPSFSLNKALLSRVRVLNFFPLNENHIEILLERAEKLEKKKLPLDAEARNMLIRMSDGDARIILGLVEEIWRQSDQNQLLSVKDLEKIIQRPLPKYDKGDDSHYNLISALHKAVRGSDPDAALYYLARMILAGEDPLFLCRRLTRIASEDIGLADPNALTIVQSATENYRLLGSPEGELAIAEACVYLATAPKSNALYQAYKAAIKDAENYGSLRPPMHILNAPTKLMKEQGYGTGYIYDHDASHGFSGQNYFPETMGAKKYYSPVERGFEREIKKRLEWWQKLRISKTSE